MSIVILRQGLSLVVGAWGDLTDASVSPKTQQSLIRILDPLVASFPPSPSHLHQVPALLRISQLRARRAGSLIFVDLIADVPGMLNVHETSALERRITQTLKKARKEVTDVRVKFNPIDVDH